MTSVNKLMFNAIILVCLTECYYSHTPWKWVLTAVYALVVRWHINTICKRRVIGVELTNKDNVLKNFTRIKK